jgi:hypothetical protein
VVLPGVGELRVREATVPLLDSFVQTGQADRGTAAAKLARSVLSGLLGRLLRRCRRQPNREGRSLHSRAEPSGLRRRDVGRLGRIRTEPLLLQALDRDVGPPPE